MLGFFFGERHKSAEHAYQMTQTICDGDLLMQVIGLGLAVNF